eukprot:5118237-Pyramimonas_sp.AAC.2
MSDAPTKFFIAFMAMAGLHLYRQRQPEQRVRNPTTQHSKCYCPPPFPSPARAGGGGRAADEEDGGAGAVPSQHGRQGHGQVHAPTHLLAHEDLLARRERPREQDALARQANVLAGQARVGIYYSSATVITQSLGPTTIKERGVHVRSVGCLGVYGALAGRVRRKVPETASKTPSMKP